MEHFVLRRLLNKRYIGDHQTLEENAVKYVPKDQRGLAKKAVEELVKRNFLLTKKKHYGVHISINPQKIEQIKEFLWE